MMASPIVRKLALIVLVAGTLFMAYRVVYNRGANAERTVWTERVEKEARENAQKTELLQTALDSYAKRLSDAQAERDKTVTVYRDKIVAAPYPNCRVSDQVMDARNAIRADEALPDAR